MALGRTRPPEGSRLRPHSRDANQTLKPKSRGRSVGGADGLDGGEASPSYHHVSTDGDVRLSTNADSWQGAPAGPHSRPRHESEEKDGMLHPSWTAIVRLPRHGWRMPPPQGRRMVSTTRSWKRR
jgi:hypothetical protein